MQGRILDVGLHVLAFLFFFGFGLFAWIGWRRITGARQLPFFGLRREQIAHGWRLLFSSLLLAFSGILVQTVLRPSFGLRPPSVSTETPLPTLYSTPSITPTTTDTPTPSITNTPEPTSTPCIPLEIMGLFQELVTPHPEAAFGPIRVGERLDYPPPITDQVFEDPAGRLYGIFSYDHVYRGVRWTAIWYCASELICIDTKPWDGEQGGWGYTDCSPSNWPLGECEIQIFLGEEWKVSARFIVIGSASIPPTSATGTPTSNP
ncbi:MAG: hypothetical protein PVF70_04085 [Anaerolineales bacterium]|jgi:hypothetical protein